MPGPATDQDRPQADDVDENAAICRCPNCRGHPYERER